MTEEQLKSILWDRFMDKLRLPAPVGSDEEPKLPVNFLGSAESYQKAFMEIEILALGKQSFLTKALRSCIITGLGALL